MCKQVPNVTVNSIDTAKRIIESNNEERNHIIRRHTADNVVVTGVENGYTIGVRFQDSWSSEQKMYIADTYPEVLRVLNNVYKQTEGHKLELLIELDRRLEEAYEFLNRLGEGDSEQEELSGDAEQVKKAEPYPPKPRHSSWR